MEISSLDTYLPDFYGEESPTPEQKERLFSLFQEALSRPKTSKSPVAIKFDRGEDPRTSGRFSFDEDYSKVWTGRLRASRSLPRSYISHIHVTELRESEFVISEYYLGFNPNTGEPDLYKLPDEDNKERDIVFGSMGQTAFSMEQNLELVSGIEFDHLSTLLESRIS